MSAHTPTLVMGHIVCLGPDDEEGFPYDEAVIHLEGDEDSEIEVHCPGAFSLAEKIVKAVNNYEDMVRHLRRLAIRACDEDALALLETAEPPVNGDVASSTEGAD